MEIKEKADKFWMHPEKSIRIDEVGDLHVQWFYDRYAAMRLLQRIPLYEVAYELLTNRGHFSRKNAFGEMHCDRYLWVEKCEHSEVIVEEGQSYLTLNIYKPGRAFHIRDLYYKYAFDKTSLKGLTLSEYRKIDFKAGLEGKIFRYGDTRDDGYLGSMDMYLKGHEKIDGANSRIMSAIKLIDFWQYYIEDPSCLE